MVIVQGLRGRSKSRTLFNRGYGFRAYRRHDRWQQSFKPSNEWMQGLRLKGRDADGFIALAQDGGFMGREAIALVQHEHARDGIEIKGAENRLHCGDLRVDIPSVGIDQMQQDIGVT